MSPRPHGKAALVRDEKPRLVYSTDGEHVTQDKSRTEPRRASSKPSQPRGAARSAVPDDGYVRIRREKGGRGGKTVTTITGLPGTDSERDALLKVLKQLCGAGGTREGAILEIQGDHRDRIEAKLTDLGHRVKRAGG